MRSVILASVVLAVTSFSASGAVLRSVEGGVKVNTEGRYSAIATTTVLKAGDRIRTSANGSAELVYDNGCIYQIPPNQRVTVRAEATCDTAELAMNGGNSGGGLLVATAVAGGIGAVALSSKSDKAVSP